MKTYRSPSSSASLPLSSASHENLRHNENCHQNLTAFPFIIHQDAEAANFVAIGGLEFLHSFYRNYFLNGFYVRFFNMSFFRSWFRFILQQKGKSKDNAQTDGLLLVANRILRRARSLPLLRRHPRFQHFQVSFAIERSKTHWSSNET